MTPRIVEQFLAALESFDRRERPSKIQKFLNELVEEKEKAKDMHWTSLLLTEAIEIMRHEIAAQQQQPPLLQLFPSPVQLTPPQQQQQQTPPLPQLFPSPLQLTLPQQQQQQQQVQPLLPLPDIPPPVQPVVKRRRVWTSEMEKLFGDCLITLGGIAAATPKKVLELMAVDGLTQEEVNSHLQYCRRKNRHQNP